MDDYRFSSLMESLCIWIRSLNCFELRELPSVILDKTEFEWENLDIIFWEKFAD